MSTKPIFMATHPRACSTAFERVFMTRHDTLKCVHEPFGDAFYYGPERLSTRFQNDEESRIKTGFSNSTYQTIFDRIDREGNEGKRIFIKDIIHYLVPPSGQPAAIAPSLNRIKRGVGTSEANGSASSNGHTETTTTDSPYPFSTKGEPNNPTVVPTEMLAKFHFTFLIRDPHSSIPSYFRCTIPPLDKMTGWLSFDPTEAGYDEVRRVFEYLRHVGQVGPHHAANGTTTNSTTNSTTNGDTNGVVNDGIPEGVEICVVDADDLLNNPTGMIAAYCKSVGIPYEPGMLKWGNEKDQQVALEAFEKWPGFHEDAIGSKELKARTHAKKAKTEYEWDADWREKYGEKAAKVIRDTVDQNMEDYLYMKQFAIKI